MRISNYWRVVLAFGVLTSLTTVLGGQAPKPSGGGNAQLIEDLVVANRILANENILDGLGHVSVRSLTNPNPFFQSRDLAPGLVTAADILEYDLDGNPVNPKGPASVRERFIHGSIYKARPDVKSVVHSHMPSVLPYADVTMPLRPMYHMAVFLVPGVPVFEIRNVQGHIGMLVDDNTSGDALAKTLGDKTVALLRGHGAAIVGSSVPDAVSNAIFLDVNARVQSQAVALGGNIHYLTQADLAPPTPNQAPSSVPGSPGYYPRSWGIWKQKAMGGTR